MNKTERFIYDLVEASGLTLNQISERAGFNENMAKKIAEGFITNPSYLTLYLLAEAAGFDLVLTVRGHDGEPDP